MAEKKVASQTTTLHPVRLDKGYMEGRGIRRMVPWPKNMQLKPIESHRNVEWFTGSKLTSMVYDADDGVLQFTDLPYDELVIVLNGTAKLTSVDGQVEVFTRTTCLAQCFELTHQLRGTAEARQVDSARIALHHNGGLGGATVVTMYGRTL